MKRDKVKTLQNKAERLWKEVCLERDGRGCQVQLQFPRIQIMHTDCYQVDHCFSRRNKLLFLEPSNGTVVCSSCNQAKGFGLKSIHRAIDEIVKAREGMDRWENMLAIDQSKSVNYEWSNLAWLEEQIRVLTKLLELMKKED